MTVKPSGNVIVQRMMTPGTPQLLGPSPQAPIYPPVPQVAAQPVKVPTGTATGPPPLQPQVAASNHMGGGAISCGIPSATASSMLTADTPSPVIYEHLLATYGQVCHSLQLLLQRGGHDMSERTTLEQLLTDTCRSVAQLRAVAAPPIAPTTHPVDISAAEVTAQDPNPAAMIAPYGMPVSGMPHMAPPPPHPMSKHPMPLPLPPLLPPPLPPMMPPPSMARPQL